MTYKQEYYIIFTIFIRRTIFTIVIITLSRITRKTLPSNEKLTIYECGFNPLETPRLPFSIKFFLIGILFLIFDLEISFLFPWCTTMNSLKWTAFIRMTLFLSILTIGFIYEWIKKRLEWE
uniref:NADH-ubiquinone oxidoreductase chain 3 n=1 Tax=Aphrocallistes vastus TaxID=83887 RepID=B2BRQ2_APHVA|nr:NADH dehydrogenase subunit 3 [Aphrocallistes vastus]ABR58846.1 NADH dehydrogenase subunit 3 [Aphrocallistes vastus]